ncbi:CPBP family intramembrane glutamic endopeptidase [Streptomyces sp. TLI_171]|uniref:CPBP family intramembrane glutamic endopeptidase n=1 Tax=Streptomyces sp. TLI_171 TaxID=1938859 RepID=UPI000C1A1C91|nr:CPBP family intramembrane glutamic endopeptidase [Streptomyces sp. TLI_171]RKE20801.1 CAAX prenyl protease-like protein [Streptomyces sp. TLI_171]
MRGTWIGPAGVFLVVAFAGAGVLGAVQPATGVPGEVVELLQFGPALGVLAVAAGWPRLVRGLWAGGAARGPWAAVLGSAAAVTGLAVAGALLLGVPVPVTGTAAPFGVVAAAQLVGACGEEAGWRCLLQPLLRERFGVWGSSVAVGLLWGCWHVQVFAQAPAYAAGFLAATVAMSVLLGAAWERIGAHRLAVAGAFHALVNLGMLVFLDEESGAVAPMLLFGAASVLVALPWVLTVRRRAAPAGITLI